MIKKNLLNIYNQFFNDIFSRSDIVEYLKISKATGTNYINYLFELDIVKQVKGKGKGKYQFK